MVTNQQPLVRLIRKLYQCWSGIEHRPAQKNQTPISIASECRTRSCHDPPKILRNNSQVVNLPRDLALPNLRSLPLKCHCNMVEYTCAAVHLCGMLPNTHVEKRHKDVTQWKNHFIHCHKPMHDGVCGINWNGQEELGKYILVWHIHPDGQK